MHELFVFVCVGGMRKYRDIVAFLKRKNSCHAIFGVASYREMEYILHRMKKIEIRQSTIANRSHKTTNSLHKDFNVSFT